MEDKRKIVRAIIFDLDGTVVKNEHIWYQTMLHMLHKRGFTTFTLEQHNAINSLTGAGIATSWQLLKKHFPLNETPEELTTETAEQANRYFEKDAQFIDGFEMFHKKLQSYAILTGIATNADEKNIGKLRKILNLERFFGENIYHIAHVENKAKPDPAIFLHTAQKLGTHPYECIVFEDSLPGFQAAQAAGMRCIAIQNARNKMHHHYVNHVITDYYQAEEALHKIAIIPTLEGP